MGSHEHVLGIDVGFVADAMGVHPNPYDLIDITSMAAEAQNMTSIRQRSTLKISDNIFMKKTRTRCNVIAKPITDVNCIVFYCIEGMVIPARCTATFSRSMVLPD